MVTPVWQLCGSHHLYDSALCSNFSSRGEKVQSFDCCSMATAEDEAISDPLREGCQTLLNASLFHPQRWQMVLPALREWCAFTAFHGIGMAALELSGQLEEAQLN